MNIFEQWGKTPKLVLGSKSPRRKYLLEQAGLQFTTLHKEVDEVYPQDMPPRDVPGYLARLKGLAVQPDAPKDAVIITSDTIVLLEEVIYGKPTDRADAIRILEKLSGKMHEVITGVCLLEKERGVVFSEVTKVYFSRLKKAEIEWYVDHYEVMDKAGAYAIQEGIGLIGIEKIEGCYFNVMGLPVHRLYIELEQFLHVP